MKNLTSFNMSDIANFFYLKSNNPLDYIINIIDIAIVAFLVYKLLVIIQDTRAWQLIKGMLIVLALAALSKAIGLTTISYIFDNVITVAAISLVVLFQPEIRRALEQLGKKNVFNNMFVDENNKRIKTTAVIEEVLKAVNRLSKSYTGALIVFERGIAIDDIAKSGVILDSQVSSELIENIFSPNTPLHDGAIIIRGDKIRAAAAFLPLTDNPDLGRNLGTRHRAAIGISEACDSIVVVVSEESGGISFVKNGSLIPNFEVDTLRKTLSNNLLKNTKDEEDYKRAIEKIKNKKFGIFNKEHPNQARWDVKAIWVIISDFLKSLIKKKTDEADETEDQNSMDQNHDHDQEHDLVSVKEAEQVTGTVEDEQQDIKGKGLTDQDE
ncbi:MAG TPA: TIGR00159 family protein [Clostridiales bacterium]|nr:TIGR00159 family protein [Clostridiales bacterium]